MKKVLKTFLLISSLVGLVACNNMMEDAKKIGDEEQGDVRIPTEQAGDNEKDNSVNEPSEPGGMALEVPGREELSTLVAETDFILVAEMTNDYNVGRTAITGENSVYMIEYEYQATIQEVPKGSSQVQLQARDSITVVVPVGMQQRLAGKEEGGLIPLFDNLPVFQEGKYLLFLERMTTDPADAKKFTPSNMNHVYREVGDEYRNIVSDSIPVIKKDIRF